MLLILIFVNVARFSIEYSVAIYPLNRLFGGVGAIRHTHISHITVDR